MFGAPGIGISCANCLYTGQIPKFIVHRKYFAALILTCIYSYGHHLVFIKTKIFLPQIRKL